MSLHTFSFFTDAKTNKPSKDVNIQDIVYEIRSGKYRDLVEAIRSEKEKKTRTELKKNLPAVTWSGVFNVRNLEGLKSYSYAICFDIDGLEVSQIDSLKKQLSFDPYVMVVFISPSGNGLKVIIPLEIGSHPVEHVKNYHEAAWNAIKYYLEKKYSVKVDISCKDICRLCFLSFDNDIYYDSEANVFDNDAIHHQLNALKKEGKPKPEKKAAPSNPTPTDIEQKIHDIVCKTAQPIEGSYNAYINNYAIQALRYGLTEDECAWAICRFCNFSSPDKDDLGTIKSVYRKFGNEEGKYLNNNYPKSTAPPLTSVATQSSVSTSTKTTVDERIKFWYAVEKVKEDKVVGIDYKFSYNGAIDFLTNNGFFKYKVDKTNFSLCHVNTGHKIINIVSELQIKEFYYSYLTERRNDQEYWQVLEMMRKGMKNYASAEMLTGLPYYLNLNLQRDTIDTAHLYFKNVFIEITKDKIEYKPYTEQKGFIWEKQIIDVDFMPCNDTSVFELYIQYAITGRKCDNAELTELDIKKLDSVHTSIGYLLHQYKNPACAKAVISVDKKERSHGEANGRSGKSLLAKGIAKLINQCYIDGPRFKFDYDFAFQDVNADTQLINFNDVPKSFPFDKLFGMITEDFTYNKKKMDGVVMPFSLSPKFYLSTNYSMRGDGESNKGRQQIIEFSDFFNSKNTPAGVFGHMFFDGWDTDEWMKFYSFMIGCLKKFMSSGLLEFPLENYGLNKLLDTSGEEFIDFMDDQVTSLRAIGTEIDKNELMKKYIEVARHHEKIKPNTFSKWITMWAGVRKMNINAHKEGERDRRNGTDFLTFTYINEEDNVNYIEAPTVIDSHQLTF